jgi:hypothetical protein
MSEEIALDFAEQIMIFEKFGNIYANEEFVQAFEVRFSWITAFIKFVG